MQHFIDVFVLLMVMALLKIITDHIIILRFQWNPISIVLIISAIFIITLTAYFITRPPFIYVVDHTSYRPPDHLRLPHSHFMNFSIHSNFFDEPALDFQRKILQLSGLGDETYMSPTLRPDHLSRPGHPFLPTLLEARTETEMMMFGALDNLFANAKIKPRDIKILVVNCSHFNPIPSFSDIIQRRYNLRHDVKSFDLAGMGCSAGVIAMGLAKDIISVHDKGGTRTSITYALVLSTENMTHGFYGGNKKTMLVSNCLFRMGAAAILLCNKKVAGAKYRVNHIVRTHLGSNNTAYECVVQEEDESGITGVSLSKTLTRVAAEALKTNISTLAIRVLPIRELILVLWNLSAKKVLRTTTRGYVPDFKEVFDHFIIHSGGRAVIDEVQKKLGLEAVHVEASRMTLQRFGNTSSSSLWYELAYEEAKGRVKKGNRVWQIAFGSGFKCNSAVLEALCDVRPASNNPWLDRIQSSPIHVLL